MDFCLFGADLASGMNWANVGCRIFVSNLFLVLADGYLNSYMSLDPKFSL
jgi:hypothetical protein